ncbi:ParA family protein [Infirmifilum uzonense]|nr:ParA family protein [Infirmifilum uzonense]
MIVVTFSGSKGGVGKTTLAIALSIVLSPSLLVDASSEGGATSYLLGDAPPPYLSQDPAGSLRRVELFDGVPLFMAVNRGAIDPGRVAEFVRGLNEFDIIIIDLPALTDIETMRRYLPLFYIADTILSVVEPTQPSILTGLKRFGEKRVVVALNVPRPLPGVAVDTYRRIVESFARRHGYGFVLVPYEPAITRLSPATVNVLNYTSPSFDKAIASLARLIKNK